MSVSPRGCKEVRGRERRGTDWGLVQHEEEGQPSMRHIESAATRRSLAVDREGQTGSTELNDALRRIFRQHWPLIVWFVALGIGIAAIHSHNPSTYSATSRFVLGADDPKSRTEAVALSDAATAIATSPTQVRDALADVRVTDRNAIDVATGVSVRSLGSAGLMETLRPTYVGSDALARVFDTPLLGSLVGDGPEPRHSAMTRVARRLCLAADAENIRSIGLVAAGPDIDLETLAAQLDEFAADVEVSARQPELTAVEALAGARGRATTTTADGEGVSRPRSANGRIRIRPFGLADGTSNGHTASAIALVAPNVLKKAELEEVDHLLRVTRLPVVGLITYKRSRVFSRSREPFEAT